MAIDKSEQAAVKTSEALTSIDRQFKELNRTLTKTNHILETFLRELNKEKTDGN